MTKSKDKPGPKVFKSYKATTSAWIESGKRVRVVSSNVAAIWFNNEEKILSVEFRVAKKIGGGAVYEYYGVPVSVAKGMFAAASMGKYVHKKLKDRYPYKRVV